MAETAFQTQFRQETIAAFEVEKSLLMSAVTHEAVIKGNTATFLVAGSGGASAVTRGTNGLIPARANDLTQTSATLTEWHDLVKATGFNIFASQGDLRQQMQRDVVKVINRKTDALILAALATGSVNTGAATTASLNLVLQAKTILGNSDVPMDGNIFAAITPAFEAYLMMTKEFASADYVENKPFSNSLTMFRWAGVNFIVHPNLSGVGTNAEECYMWHRSAIGHAVDTAGMQTEVGYDAEQAYSYARCSVHMGSKLLQSAGVVNINHDGSALVAA